MEDGWLQGWCYLYRVVILSDMSSDPVLLSDMPACTVQLHKTCMLGSFLQIRAFVKVSIRQSIWYVTNLSDMPTGKVSNSLCLSGSPTIDIKI